MKYKCILLIWIMLYFPVDYCTGEDTEDCAPRLEKLLSFSDPNSIPFIDALGKPSSGMTAEYMFRWHGNYGQCINTDSLVEAGFVPCRTEGSITGISIPGMGNTGFPIDFKWTHCLPPECKKTFVIAIADRLEGILINITNIKDFYTPGTLKNAVKDFKTTCQEGRKFDAGAYVAMVIISIFIALNVLCTLWKPVRSFAKTFSSLLTGDEIKRDETELRVNQVACTMASLDEYELPKKTDTLPYDVDCNKQQKGTIEKLIDCFDLNGNLKILMDTSTKPGQVECLNGIRVLSIAWVVIGHFYMFLSGFSDRGSMAEILERRDFDLILNAFPSVDTFFLISGFLNGYLLIKTLNRGKVKISTFAVGYYIHRYIRLTAPYVIVILINGFLYRQFVTGPSADMLEAMNSGCKDRWWTNLLYINNFHLSDCVGETWYLANDMQFYIVAPIFIYLLWAKPIVGNLVCWSLTVGSMIASGVVTYEYGYGATSLRNGNIKYFEEFYIKPYFRLVPYFVGIFGGWLYQLYTKQPKHDSSPQQQALLKLTALLLWLITIGVEYGVVFGTFSSDIFSGLGKSQGDKVTVPYNTLSKLAWSLALLIQIFLCQAGLGGPIEKLLSWRCWLPLTRLSYGLYLLHSGMMIVLFAQIRSVTNFLPDFQVVTTFLGFMVVGNLGSALLFLTVEQPIGSLEKLLFSSLTGKS